MKKVVVALAMGTVLAGCASQTYWKKPGLDQVVFRQDAAQCAMYANGQTSSYMAMAGGDPYATMFGAITSQAYAQKALEICMEAKGYMQVPAGSE